MSLTHIKHTVGKFFNITTENFEIQIRESSERSYMLDEEYLESIYAQLPLTSISTLSGDILLKHPESFHASSSCDKEVKLAYPVRDSLCEWSIVDNENKIPEEVSLIYRQDEEPESFEALLFTTTAEEVEKTNACSSNQFDYLNNSFDLLTNVNRTNSLPSNDEIKRHICHPDTSTVQGISETTFQSNDNELDIIVGRDFEAQTVVQNVVDTSARRPGNVGTPPVESLGTNWSNQNSDDLTSHLPDQIAQQMPSIELSSSLQFVRDVHPYQKTQHNTDNSDEHIDKKLLPYVMRIQGIKTNVDKGKSILPRIKVPPSYIALYKQKKQQIKLLTAAVREKKVNDKRCLYACNDMQFLPDNTEKKSEAVNPIQLQFDLLPIESDGTFELSLRLLNNPLQSTTEQSKNKPFYELDEERAANLHPGPYDPRFFRLVCILVKDNNILWDTMCFSDYIRPKQQLQA